MLKPVERKLGTIELGLSLAVPRAGIPAKASFQTWAQAAFDALSPSSFALHVGLSLRLVGLDEGRALNLQYRGRDYATNVLSFPADVPAGMPKNFKRDWLGDLVVCAPVIAREAIEQQKVLRDHHAHMCVHGVLHLLGLDHLKAAEAKRMEALELQILARFGIADPYKAT
jgi:probable rRNA maturation factor